MKEDPCSKINLMDPLSSLFSVATYINKVDIPIIVCQNTKYLYQTL